MKQILTLLLVFITVQSFGQADKILTRNGTTIDTVTTLESKASAANRMTLLQTNINAKASITTPQFITNITTPIVIGSTSSAGTLTLSSTSNATKGKLLFGTNSVYDEANDRLGVGTTSPNSKMHFKAGGTGYGVGGIRFEQSADAQYWDIMPAFNSLFFGFNSSSIYTLTTTSIAMGAVAQISRSISTNSWLGVGGGMVGIGTSSPAASAKLDISSTTQGVLFPRLTTTQINAISSPATGLTVYCTTENTICFFNGTTWQKVTSTNL